MVVEIWNNKFQAFLTLELRVLFFQPLQLKKK